MIITQNEINLIKEQGLTLFYKTKEIDSMNGKLIQHYI